MTEKTEGYKRLAFAVLTKGPDEEDALPIRECDMSAIDKVVDSLGERKAYVLRKRFGLAGNDVQFLEEIGSFFAVTKECIRQQEAKALRMLRHPLRCGAFKMLFRSELEDMLQRRDVLIEEMKREVASIKEGAKKKVMQKRWNSGRLNLGIQSSGEVTIDKLRFTTRVNTCLKKSNIATLPELLEKTEEDLLRIVGFGRKSMHELKTHLLGLGLELAKKAEW